MCYMMTANRNAEMLVRVHHYWMRILMILVNKQTIKIIELANCVGEAEPAGQTVVERQCRGRNIK